MKTYILVLLAVSSFLSISTSQATTVPMCDATELGLPKKIMYPRIELVEQWTGVFEMSMHVDLKGRPPEVMIEHSSHVLEVDRAARDILKRSTLSKACVGRLGPDVIVRVSVTVGDHGKFEVLAITRGTPPHRFLN